MKFLIITHVVHTQKGNDFFAYAPYVNEMNIWLKNVDKVIIVAPLENLDLDTIFQKYNHNNIKFISVPQFSFLSLKETIKSICIIPLILLKITWAMMLANHIHLRCPGNMGLLGSFVQMFFPFKKKSAKYAGNWGSNYKQPMSYRVQKWILSNTFLTHNMKVLVYGEWKNQTKNIKSFFTATYFESEIREVQPRSLNEKIKFLFVGTLSKGKQPIYAIQIVEKLREMGNDVELSLYGKGHENKNLEKYINDNNLNQFIFLKGTSDRDSMKEIYQNSHFVLLPSKSEGWPKVIAEAMFWGCLPIATKVSCVPNMLDFGSRGILLEENIAADIKMILDCISDKEEYNTKIFKAIRWSHNFTIDKFENEIKQIINS